MLCVDLFLAVAVSTMQSLNGGREPGHRRTPNLNRVSKEQSAKREEVTTNQKLMLCVAVAISMLQSLNRGRETGHRRCMRRGWRTRGDAAAVTGGGGGGGADPRRPRRGGVAATAAVSAATAAVAAARGEEERHVQLLHLGRPRVLGRRGLGREQRRPDRRVAVRLPPGHRLPRPATPPPPPTW